MTFDDIEDFLEKHRNKKMSFGLEYSSVIDWVAEFVPRRGHPLCRQYNGPWRAAGISPDLAIQAAMDRCEAMLEESS